MDLKEQRKAFEKRNSELEKKVVELDDYKRIKFAEERELKIKKRKELKKINQKLKKEKEKELSSEEDTNKNVIKLGKVETTEPETFYKSEVLEEKPGINHNFEAGEDDVENSPDEINSVGKSEFEEGFEYEEGFIGPRLPRRMTQAEVQEFFEKVMGKLNFPS